MSTIGNINNPLNNRDLTELNKNNRQNRTGESVDEKVKSQDKAETKAVDYTTSDATAKANYKPDMDKVRAMKEETDQRLIDLFRDTVKGGALKQLGGLRGYLQRLINGESTEDDFALELGIEITPEAIEKAKVDVAEDGYWGAKATSDRFLEFAKALSGGDPAKADMLLDAVKAGYEEAEAIWGSELPALSKETLDLTIKKFEAWRDGEEA
ncbi:conserved protein of unknown function [Petrocella atlantisensis]|uniref:Uncharacterized protein n=1 Tax=Petrocella atlantisensis TaxID=2173034 RepID=A0A3P7S2W5_9FIRM|nr:hypothetical protein [Petrocella atlantisensis]VDN49176.1 conserved protein of unknown function [Petrocella atlantisensis]